MREAVIDAFFATSEHVDLQALFEAARRRHPRVGLATVYRTMKLLDEAGLAQPCRFENGRGTVYEVAGARHDHLICDECGQIVEFTDERWCSSSSSW